jgi:GNAT superfamily N-acetyltransferase
MKIEIYTISELQEYILSDKYKKSATIVVSPERVVSYMNNPRAEKNMPVIFIITENDQIIAYRTLLPDTFEGISGKTSFAWLSGNYVHPDHRRMGNSTRLFNEVRDAWRGKLMYTNYAPASKAVYDKTRSFEQYSERPGMRYYMRSSLTTLYKERIKSEGILKLGDKILNAMHDLQIGNMSFELPEDISINQIESTDEELSELIDSQYESKLFSRGISEFNWIRNFPWVIENPTELVEAEYQFTRKVSKFKNKWFKLKSKNGIAFLWVIHINNKCSVPYFLHNDRMLVLAARQIVLNEMLENQSAYITIRHPELGPILNTRKNPFLLSRRMPQRYYAHTDLIGSLPDNKDICDGDGDCVFTL